MSKHWQPRFRARLWQSLTLIFLLSGHLSVAAQSDDKAVADLRDLQRKLSLAVVTQPKNAKASGAKARELRQQGFALWANAPDDQRRQLVLDSLQRWGLLAGLPGWNPQARLPQFTEANLPPSPNLRKDASSINFEQPTRPLVVHFWAHWCGPCRQELPQLATYYAEQYLALRSAGIELVTINNDPTFDAAADIGQLPVLHDPDFDLYRQIAQTHEVALPATFLLQPNAPHQVLAYGPMEWLAPQVTQNLQALVQKR